MKDLFYLFPSLKKVSHQINNMFARSNLSKTCSMMLTMDRNDWDRIDLINWIFIDELALQGFFFIFFAHPFRPSILLFWMENWFMWIDGDLIRCERSWCRRKELGKREVFMKNYKWKVWEKINDSNKKQFKWLQKKCQQIIFFTKFYKIDNIFLFSVKTFSMT